ncbi:MAG: HAMP domain-containing protein [Terriglobia bacterium]
MRRRVASSLAIVRLILVPVILLSIYYLIVMARTLDRIVSVDAPVASMAQQMSIQMLDARRAEKNYILLHTTEDLEANRQALSRLEQTLAACEELQPDEKPNLERIQSEVRFYRERFHEVVGRMGQPVQAPLTRIQEVVRAYEKDLDDLLKRSPGRSHGELVDELRTRVGSFDAQITASLATEDPTLRQATADLRTSSDEIMRLAGQLEKRSWERVQHSHEQAGALVRRAEWVLITVSALTLILSVWVSFVLPRTVVKPLVDLKAAVDQAAAGDYEIEFDVEGEAEVVQLAESVRNLIDHVREKKDHLVNKS